jgi:hypothetical protein
MYKLFLVGSRGIGKNLEWFLEPVRRKYGGSILDGFLEIACFPSVEDMMESPGFKQAAQSQDRGMVLINHTQYMGDGLGERIPKVREAYRKAEICLLVGPGESVEASKVRADDTFEMFGDYSDLCIAVERGLGGSGIA